MRRLLSIFLVAFFSLGPLAATLEAGSDAGLPPCCRRHGAHHCAMRMRMAAALASGKPTLTTPSTCPAYPTAGTAAASGPQVLLAQPGGLPALLACLRAPAASFARTSHGSRLARSGRAPPAAPQA